MKLFTIADRKIGIPHALFTLTAMVAWFAILRFAGLSDQIWLRAFNSLIIFGGVYLAVRKYRKTYSKDFSYLKVFGFGLKMSAIIGVLFSAGMVVYISLFDPYMVKMIQEKLHMGAEWVPYLSIPVLLVETMISGMIATFISLQFFKKPMKEFKENEETHTSKEKIASNPR